MPAAPSVEPALAVVNIWLRAILVITLVSATATGCASKSEGPEVLSVSAGQYPAAFDAATEVARRAGLPAALRDRRGGVIETTPRMAGSALEPWRIDNASLGQSLENTIAYQRRRARFEFAPAGEGSFSEVPTSQPLTGPDVVNAQQQPLDLSQITGDGGGLELRVWVYVERASVPGIRRSTWTRSKTTQAQLVYPEGMKDRPRGLVVNWTPVARDPDYERRLLGAVQDLLASGEFDGTNEIDPPTTTEDSASDLRPATNENEPSRPKLE